jgi:hypothetical protein
VALIAWLAVSGAAATLVPQGEDGQFYRDRYPAPLASAMAASGFTDFFRSWLFIAPAAVFFANLSTCAAARFLRQLRTTGRRSFGPDLLHFGLMLLVAVSALSPSLRREGYVNLREGDNVELPGGAVLSLAGFEYLAYPDGRPKEWTSTVAVREGAATVLPSYPIRVNHPLRLGSISLYQASHGVERVLVLRDPSGAERSIAAGEEAVAVDERIRLLAFDQGAGTALVRSVTPAGSRELAVGPGGKAGGFTVLGNREADSSGLKVVIDPCYPIVLLSFIVTLAGLAATFIRKLRERET